MTVLTTATSLISMKWASIAQADGFDRVLAQLAERVGMDAALFGKLLASITIILAIMLARWIALRLVWKQISDIKRHYHWRRTINYIAGIIALLLIARVWFHGLREFGVILGLASAGIAIALRDPLTCLAGWLFILIRRPFIVGDRIEINGQRGDVIDIRMFQTYMMECGNWIDGDQSTGRIVVVPNGAIFTSPLANYTHGFEYVWDEIQVRLTFDSDWRRAKEILTEIADTHASPLCKDAQHQIRQAAAEHMIFFQKLTPIVYTSVKEWGIQLTVRYLTPARGRRGSAQRLWEATLQAFRDEPHIAFAYPTTRVYYHATEAKPEMRRDGAAPVAPSRPPNAEF